MPPGGVVESRLPIGRLDVEVGASLVTQPLADIDVPLISGNMKRCELTGAALGLPRVAPVRVRTLFLGTAKSTKKRESRECH